MIKKVFLILVFVFLVNARVFAKEIQVKLETLKKISTSNVHIQEGDNIHFTVAEDVYVNSKLYIKKGADVDGIITSLVNNGFTCQSASIYAEQFKVKNVNGNKVKLNGIVFKQGRNHSMVTQYIEKGFILIRGGEAEILPKKDIFTLYMENDSNDDL